MPLLKGTSKADQAADTATNGAAIGAEIDKKRLEAIKKVKAETAQQVP